MKKVLVIASIAIFTIAFATLYSNSASAVEKPSSSISSDSTKTDKPCEPKSDTTGCHKAKAEACKKSCANPCCKKS